MPCPVLKALLFLRHLRRGDWAGGPFWSEHRGMEEQHARSPANLYTSRLGIFGTLVWNPKTARRGKRRGRRVGGLRVPNPRAARFATWLGPAEPRWPPTEGLVKLREREGQSVA